MNGHKKLYKKYVCKKEICCCVAWNEVNRKKNIMKFVNRIIVAILSRTFYNKYDS